MEPMTPSDLPSDPAVRPRDGTVMMVWDLPVRLFHWGLVLSLAGAWWTAENGRMDWHMRCGYAVLALILFRLLWGFAGSETARFARFVRGPRAILADLRQLAAPGRLHPHRGHNALGAIAVLALLGLAFLQAATGLFTSDGIFTDGPLVAWVDGGTAKLLRTIHLTNFDLLLIMVGLHVAAILAYALLKRLDLVRPMVTGRARLADGLPPPRMVSPWRAFVLAGISIASVWALVGFA